MTPSLGLDFSGNHDGYLTRGLRRATAAQQAAGREGPPADKDFGWRLDDRPDAGRAARGDRYPVVSAIITSFPAGTSPC